jgi:hypothetical protein
MQFPHMLQLKSMPLISLLKSMPLISLSIEITIPSPKDGGGMGKKGSRKR